MSEDLLFLAVAPPALVAGVLCAAMFHDGEGQNFLVLATALSGLFAGLLHIAVGVVLS